MAISSYPVSSGGTYSTTILLPADSDARYVSFTSLRKGVYAPLLVAGQYKFNSQYYSSTVLYPYQGVEEGATPDASASSYENQGVRLGMLESSTNSPYYTIYGNLDASNQMIGHRDTATPEVSFYIGTDNTTLKLLVVTYRTTTLRATLKDILSSATVKGPTLIKGGSRFVCWHDWTKTLNSEIQGIQYFSTSAYSTNAMGTKTSLSTVFAASTGFMTKLLFNDSLTQKWVALGCTGTSGSRTPTISSSTDLVTWNSRTVGGSFTSPATYNWITCGTFSNSVWAVGGAVGTGVGNGASRIWTSTDSITWTQTYTTGNAGFYGFLHMAGITTATEKFIVYSTDDNSVYSSTDATTWTLRTTALPSGRSLTSMSAANGIYFITGNDNTTGYPFVMYSTNGSTWTQGTIRYAMSNSFNEVQYVGTHYTATNQHGLMISTDGVTFDYVTANHYLPGDYSDIGPGYHPFGLGFVSDGTNWGYLKQNRPFYGTEPNAIFFTTASISTFLYGRSHPHVDYAYSIPTPGETPRIAT